MSKITFKLQDANSDAIDAIADNEICLVVLDPEQPPRWANFKRSAYMHWHDGNRHVRPMFFARVKDGKVSQ